MATAPASRIKKATKAQAKLRAGISGPTGSGKTFSALKIAMGLIESTGGRIGMIDTEHGTASKYSDRFDFDVLDLEDHRTEAYIEAFYEFAEAGYKVLIVDSISHAWYSLKDEIEQLAEDNYKGNNWRAWSQGTPRQRTFVEAILTYPGHVISTMRSKMAYESGGSGGDGKGGKVHRIGLEPVQGKDIEYEFDLLLEMSGTHNARVVKDRSGKYQDKTINLPGEKFGRELAAWLSEGATPTAAPKIAHHEEAEAGDDNDARDTSRADAAKQRAKDAKEKRQAEQTSDTPEPWAAHIDRVTKTANDAWLNAQAIAGVTKDARKELVNRYQITNAVVSRAIESGRLQAEAIENPAKPGTRDRDKARNAAENIYNKATAKVQKFIAEYIEEKENEAAEALADTFKAEAQMKQTAAQAEAKTKTQTKAPSAAECLTSFAKESNRRWFKDCAEGNWTPEEARTLVDVYALAEHCFRGFSDDVIGVQPKMFANKLQPFFVEDPARVEMLCKEYEAQRRKVESHRLDSLTGEADQPEPKRTREPGEEG